MPKEKGKTDTIQVVGMLKMDKAGMVEKGKWLTPNMIHSWMVKLLAALICCSC